MVQTSGSKGNKGMGFNRSLKIYERESGEDSIQSRHWHQASSRFRSPQIKNQNNSPKSRGELAEYADNLFKPANYHHFSLYAHAPVFLKSSISKTHNLFRKQNTKKKKILFNCLILIKHQLFNLFKKIYNIDPVQSVALNIELKKNLYLIFNNRSLF